jgi:hypothetical protein
MSASAVQAMYDGPATVVRAALTAGVLPAAASAVDTYARPDRDAMSRKDITVVGWRGRTTDAPR